MKKILLTGMNGTLAPVLAEELRRRGVEVVGWDRGVASPDDRVMVERFVRETKPSALIHCAMGGPQWSEDMARVCAEEGITFLYISSASVYGTQQYGPFTVYDTPEPSDDYGRYKLECEQRVRAVNPDVRIARIGWQIALRRGGNQMTEYLAQRQAEDGHIAASAEWFPACSFLADTARTLADVIGLSSGLYLLDGNPGWSFRDIAAALNAAMGGKWDVRSTQEFRWNNRMIDSGLWIKSIECALALSKWPRQS
jgi:dTDP-4-dehydrorhamnose reductase